MPFDLSSWLIWENVIWHPATGEAHQLLSAEPAKCWQHNTAVNFANWCIYPDKSILGEQFTMSHHTPIVWVSFPDTRCGTRWDDTRWDERNKQPQPTLSKKPLQEWDEFGLTSPPDTSNLQSFTVQERTTHIPWQRLNLSSFFFQKKQKYS